MNRKKIENCRYKSGFIDLNKLKNYREKGVVVEGSNAKTWFNVNGVRFLFKEYNSILPCFGEVLYYNAAKMCGVDCAEYDFATMDGKVGTISYDFLNSTEVYYNFLELSSQFGDSKFNLDDIVDNRNMLVLRNNQYNNLSAIRMIISELFRCSSDKKEEIEVSLIKMVCLDTLFCHLDRTLWNYGVIVDEDIDEFRLVPLYDNSYVLYLHRGESYIEEGIYDLINEDISTGSQLEFKCDSTISDFIEFYSNCSEDRRAIIEGIVNKLNVDELYDSTSKYCEIGKVYELWIKALLNFRKKTILRGLESVRIMDDEAQIPNVAFSKRK